MQRPKVIRDVLMFPASLSLSPLFLVLVYLSDPAKSHSDNLQEETK